ncbi:Paf1-domain-containing protein [Cladochytrium replicatum]|nr:Paf1-domain-containing protein [Cladochytrium replicatum]
MSSQSQSQSHGANGSASGGAGSRKPADHFACKVRYLNDLPPLPFEPKLLPVPPLQPDRLYRFEEDHPFHKRRKVEVRGGGDGTGFEIDLLRLGVIERALRKPGEPMVPVDRSKLHPDDLRILEANPLKAAVSAKRQTNGVKSQTVEVKPELKPAPSWLLNNSRSRTVQGVTLIPNSPGKALTKTTQSTSASASTSRKTTGAASSSFVAVNTEPPPIPTTIDEQIAGIEATFAQVSSLQDLRHPTNKNIEAKEMFPIFPQFYSFQHSWTVVEFQDQDPIQNVVVTDEGKMDERKIGPESDGLDVKGKWPAGENAKLKREELKEKQKENSLLMTTSDPLESRNTNLLYFAPTPSTLNILEGDRRPKEQCEYYCASEHVLQQHDKGLKLFFELHEERGAFYSEVHGRVVLRRKRPPAKEKLEALRALDDRPTHIITTLRGATADEKEQRKEKLQDLLPNDALEDLENGDSEEDAEGSEVENGLSRIDEDGSEDEDLEREFRKIQGGEEKGPAPRNLAGDSDDDLMVDDDG